MAQMFNLAPISRVRRDQPQTFTSDEERKRLTFVALKAFRNLASEWGLTNHEAGHLLGASDSTWDRIKRGTWNSSLNQDQLTRISAVVGIFKGLNLLFGDGFANKWPSLKNSGPLYGNRTPIETMIDGGIPIMLDIRRHIDAVRGGI